MSSLSFSYAQAAKGLAPSSNISSNPASSASSDHGARDTSLKSDPSTIQSKSSRPLKSERDTTHQSKSSQPSHSSNDVETASPQDKVSSHTVDVAAEDSKSTQSHMSSTDDDIMEVKPVEISQVVTFDHIQDSENSLAGRKAESETSDEQTKAKEADDEWEKVSIPSSTADKELRAAPIPMVNVWQQRREAQQLKVKEQSGQRQPTPAQNQSKPQLQSTVADDSKKKGANRDTTNSETARISPGRVNSGGRTPRDQRGNSASPRSVSQQKEQPATQAPPPVDAASWPTPESAITDTGRRSSLLDKAEKSEAADVKPAARKNQWTTLPFVPSVKFETQIPSGRRGGRASNTRGGGRGTTERNPERTEPGSMGPPPVPKTVSDQDRGRKGTNSRSARASSVPTEGQKEATVPDVQHATNQLPAKDFGTAVPQSQTPPVNDLVSGVEGASSNDPSRSSSRQASANVNAKLEVEQASTQVVDSADNPSKQTHRSDRHSTADNLRLTSEGTEKPLKEWQKERSNKSDSWRAEQRSERSERGRGNYRGRGNRAGYNNPSFTTPLPQNGFEINKHSGASDARTSRQSSQNYGTPSFGSQRGSSRAQSIPIGMLQGAYYQPPQGYPQPLAPIQTDMGYSAYAQMPNGMSNGIMSAMPYNEPLSGYALMSMISKQLEYYFSLDNLCKDMFLRRNMDSQGFVLLRVIADFRRIKTLLGEGSMSFLHLRDVAAHVPNTEYVTGEDGEDRIRSRGNWKDFVLPVDERVLQAQNDGPQIKTSQSRQSVSMPPEFHMGNGLRSAPPNMNGFHDAFVAHHGSAQYPSGLVDPDLGERWPTRVESPQTEDRRPSVTSPVSKVLSPPPESPENLFRTLTNGHRDSMSSQPWVNENTFPTENIALLKVVVKDPEYQGHEESAVMEEPIPLRSSGLRGGAGSPEQIERIRSLQFGQNPVAFKTSGEQAMYFTQDEGPSPELMRPGYIHEDYTTLHEQAEAQRREHHYNGAMLVLYPLWADFLAVPNQFNVNMYEEFKNWAIEDEKHGNDNGKKFLVKFYDAMLGSNNPMSPRIASDITSIVRVETGSHRPLWLKLRAAWRNGATNLKTRKQLADIMTRGEREELDRNS